MIGCGDAVESVTALKRMLPSLVSQPVVPVFDWVTQSKVRLTGTSIRYVRREGALYRVDGSNEIDGRSNFKSNNMSCMSTVFGH